MWEEEMHLKHASSRSSAETFLDYVPVLLVCCFSFVRWNEIVNLCSNCSIYIVIEVLYVCLQIHG